MKKDIIKATQAHLEAGIEKHKTNIEVMLENPMAIHDHTDIMSAIDSELSKMSEHCDKLETLNTYWNLKNQK